MKTLVVDDHEMFRMGLCALLGQMSDDYDIHEEGTLQGAMDYVASEPDIELILVDFQLPDGSGLELVKQLKDTHLRCKIIVMSGHESQDLAVEAMVSGANGFLPKSFASVEVKSALAQIVEGEFYVPEKLKRSSQSDTSTMVAGKLLSVGSNVLDNALDPVIIFENTTKPKLEYINQAAIVALGLSESRIGEEFEVTEYVKNDELLAFISDDSKESYINSAIYTDVFSGKGLWLSVSCSKIEFLNTPSVMIYLRDVTELKQRELDLEKASSTDPLTELLNRRGFSEKALQELERAKRFYQPMAVAMCDLDFFKRLNDTYGHDFGDLVLTEFAKVCDKTFRKQDLLARFGGEEFVILLVNTHAKDALVIVDRLRENWQQHAAVLDGQPCASTVSIGLTNLQETDNHVDELIKRADGLLYQSKENGRNKVSTDFI